MGLRTFAGAVAMIAIASPLRAEDSPLHALLGAPDELTIRGSMRSRLEAVDGQLRPGVAKSDFLWSLRTDIFAEYDAGPVQIGAEFRDARGYGERENSSVGVSDINTFEPLQAYLTVDLAKGATLTGGRFTMEQGAGRLIAHPDFANSINSFTGAAFDWTGKSKAHLNLFWAMPSLRLPTDAAYLHHNETRVDKARGGFQFFGGDFTRPGLIGDVAAETYVYRLAERDAADQLTRNRHLVTYGLRLFRKPEAGAFDFEGEADRQTGHARATTSATDLKDLDVSALLLHGEVGRKFKGLWSPRVSIHVDHISGEDDDPDRITRFDGLFGATRSDYGPTGLFGMVARANLNSVGVRVEGTASKRLDGFIMGRGLWLDSDTDSFGSTGVRDKTGKSGSYAGTQVEGRVRYWFIPKRLRMELGGAILARGRFLNHAPNAPDTGDTHYVYFDLATEF